MNLRKLFLGTLAFEIWGVLNFALGGLYVAALMLCPKLINLVRVLL